MHLFPQSSNGTPVPLPYFFFPKHLLKGMLVVEVDDDDSDPPRQDFKSSDMKRVHPEILNESSLFERVQHLIECDNTAYSQIAKTYPTLRPPRLGANL